MRYQTERFEKELRVLNETIWNAAELKFEEFQSMSAMTEFLAAHGFLVEAGTGGIPTAFHAVYGSGRPVIGLLAEYDALDGLSQKAGIFKQEPRPETTHGHGCGHNLLGTGA